jgi:hypothetical protein
MQRILVYEYTLIKMTRNVKRENLTVKSIEQAFFWSKLIIMQRFQTIEKLTPTETDRGKSIPSPLLLNILKVLEKTVSKRKTVQSL